jgi:hypothetical protein
MNKVFGTLYLPPNENYLNRGFPPTFWKYFETTTIINIKDNYQIITQL